MKKLVIGLITVYQSLFSPLLKQLLGVKVQCRYSPSCSAYTKHAVATHGVWKGLLMGGKRVLQCQPFTKAYGYH